MTSALWLASLCPERQLSNLFGRHEPELAIARRIAFLIYPDFQILDAAGPIATFEIAARLEPGTYVLQTIATTPGAVVSSSGCSLLATGLPRPATIDTLVISGGFGSRTAMTCERTLEFIRACSERSRRVTSVCSGAYLLAAADLLDGKRATTHWTRSKDLQKKFPKVRVDADPIFVKAGKVWTSAGITAGIDLSLALIAEDLGEQVSRRTAQQMVVYYRRPGGQSQFSALLDLGPSAERFTDLIDHMRANLRKPLSVADLAARAHMSTRHFAREFLAATGMTPAKAVERMRAEAARAAIESGRRSVQEIARACGFGAPERMRRTFVRLFGISPAAMKRATDTGAG